MSKSLLCTVFASLFAALVVKRSYLYVPEDSIGRTVHGETIRYYRQGWHLICPLSERDPTHMHALCYSE